MAEALKGQQRMGVTVAEEALFYLTAAFFLLAAYFFLKAGYMSYRAKNAKTETASSFWTIIPGAFLPDSKLTDEGKSYKVISWRSEFHSILCLSVGLGIVVIGIEILKYLDQAK